MAVPSTLIQNFLSCSPTQEQNQVILQGTRLMDAYRTDNLFKPIIADASPVIVGLTDGKKVEQARELIECLRVLGQVCKGVEMN